MMCTGPCSPHHNGEKSLKPCKLLVSFCWAFCHSDEEANTLQYATVFS